MEQMKYDMSGAAAVFGTLQAAARLKLPYRVVGIVAAAENMPSGTAQKPGDVITTLSGKTVEVLNTDAEGRLVLSDCLHYAKRYQPNCTVDLATLTGACMVALGEEISGLMGNDADFTEKIMASAAKAGESVWPLPLEKRYRKLIDSRVADVQNIGGKYGGTLTAGLFLQEFVGEIPWAHIDIAGPAYAERPLNAYTRLGGTGFGVRTILEMIKE